MPTLYKMIIKPFFYIQENFFNMTNFLEKPNLDYLTIVLIKYISFSYLDVFHYLTWALNILFC